MKTLRNLLPGILFAAALVMVYAIVQVNDDRATRQESILVCPPQINEYMFTHSGFTRLDLSRPGQARSSCYYRRGK